MSIDFLWRFCLVCWDMLYNLCSSSQAEIRSSNFTGPHFLPSSQMIWLGVWQVHGLNAVQAVFCTVPSCWSSSKGILSCCSHATLLSKTWSQLQAVEVGGSIPPKNSLFNHFNLPVCSCPSKVTLCFSMFFRDFTLYICIYMFQYVFHLKITQKWAKVQRSDHPKVWSPPRCFPMAPLHPQCPESPGTASWLSPQVRWPRSEYLEQDTRQQNWEVLEANCEFVEGGFKTTMIL